MAKNLEINANPRTKPSSLDDFVTGNQAPVTEKPEMVKMTFDVSLELRTNFKIACAKNRVDMGDELRAFMEGYLMRDKGIRE